MTDEKKDEDTPVKIYKETPGAGINNAVPVKLLKEGSEKMESKALKKLTAQKEEAKQNEQQQNDTSGEDG